MAERLLVMVTRGPEDGDRATVALVMAQSALALNKSVVVLLTLEGVRLGVPAVARAIQEPGLPRFLDLWEGILQDGGAVWACTPCVEKRGLRDALDPRIRPVGAVAAVEFLMDGGTSLSF